MRSRLTTTSIEAAVCPPEKTEILLWDAGCPGLAVRVHRSGSKAWCLRYRHGKGRSAPLRRLTLGAVEKLGPAEARLAARKFLGEVAQGQDPAGRAAVDKAEARATKRATLGAAIDDYEVELTKRRIVKRNEVLSALRRELRDRLGASTDVRKLTRKDLVDRLEEVARMRPGAAGYLRKAATGFLEWLANRGVIAVSPLAGYRKPRRSRAEIVEQTGRALGDAEVKALWAAAGDRFGTLVRLCLLTGVRRGEAGALEWGDLDLDAGTWAIRAEVAKTGRARVVYLAPASVDLLRTAPVINDTPLVFPSDKATVITGWTKRVAGLVKASGVDFTMHDTRRTFRTGLSRIGVDKDTAELCLGHWRGDLIEAYDRDVAEQRQRRALEGWAEHVLAVVGEGAGEVVPLRRAGHA
jgi:integrase